MELIEEVLDEENEKILSKLDDTIGISQNKNVLRDIIKYHQVIKEGDCNIECANYNIIIRNESSYNLYEELISIIAQIYYKNKIISSPDILYLNRDDFRSNKNKKEEKKEKNIIKQGLIVLDLDTLRSEANEIRKCDIESVIENKQEESKKIKIGFAI